MKQEIINQLNQLAKENEPFLFVINYEGTEAYIRKLSEIDPAACLYDFEGVSNAGTMASQPLPSSILWDVEAPLYEDYEKSFELWSAISKQATPTSSISPVLWPCAATSRWRRSSSTPRENIN